MEKINSLETQAALVMDSVMDASPLPALSIKRVPSPKVIRSVETSESVPTEMAGANDNESLSLSSSSAIDSTISVPVVDSAPILEHTTVISMSSSSSSSSSQSSIGLKTIQSSRKFSNGRNQDGRFPNQRGNGFNSKGGKREGDQKFSNRHHQRGFNTWNHNGGGFNSNSNANARLVNSQQFNCSSGFIGPRSTLPHFFHRSTPMVNPQYVNVKHTVFLPPPIPGYVFPNYGNANNSGVSNPLYCPPLPPLHSVPSQPQPPYVDAISGAPPIPGYVFPYYGNANNSGVSNPLYCPPVPPLHSVPSQSPYVDAISGALTYNQPIFPNSEVGLCNKILYQIEYYFSRENLEKDFYMKTLMDDEGWIPVRLIARFRRIKAMTSDINLIVRSLQLSAVVEVQGGKIRRRGDWMNWAPNRTTDAQIGSVSDISRGIQDVQLGEKAGADALVADDLNRLRAQMKISSAS